MMEDLEALMGLAPKDKNKLTILYRIMVN